MNSENISHLRLLNQQISSSEFSSVKKLVGFMGAMQAQDYRMATWAIGLRLPGHTQKQIVSAINKGEIFRTHVLRPTWHFVAADDIYWMLKLSKPSIGTALKSRQKQLELSDTLLTKTNNIIVKALEGGKYLTREELVALFHKAKISTNDNRSSHIIMQAELEGLIGSGKIKENRPTYALLSERVKKKKEFSREEALEKLASRYFLSHGPATLADFTWWSGLGIREARQGLELAKETLISEKINDTIYWLPPSLKLPAKHKPSVHFLPAFDEFLISYKNRSASLMTQHSNRIISTNGIFWPTIIVNGRVKGLWKRSMVKDEVIIDIDLFHSNTKVVEGLLKKSAEKIGDFLEKKILLRHV